MTERCNVFGGEWIKAGRGVSRARGSVGLEPLAGA